MMSSGGGTVPDMAAPSESSIAEIEAKLDEATRALASVEQLRGRDAERIEEKMERLASQLLEVTAPIPMSEIHERLGTTPVSPEEFAELSKYMLPPDGEG
jgi:hypothetical protein